MTENKISNLSDLKQLAQDTVARLGARALLLLSGPMGVGKTQFTRFLLDELSCDETVSPSFAIHNTYHSRLGNVEHIDLFRLESEADLESTGFWDLFEATEGIFIIEWADRLSEFGVLDQLPRSWLKISMQFEFVSGPASEERRILVVEKY